MSSKFLFIFFMSFTPFFIDGSAQSLKFEQALSKVAILQKAKKETSERNFAAALDRAKNQMKQQLAKNCTESNGVVMYKQHSTQQSRAQADARSMGF